MKWYSISVARIERYISLYRAFLRTSLLDNIQYRASGMIWMIGAILEPVIFLVVWSTVADSRGGEVGGFDAHQFAAYYIILMAINHLTFTWIMQTFQFRIQYGFLSHELLRPVHPIHGDISDNIAYKIIQMAVMIPAVIILILLFDPVFELQLWRIAVVVPVIVLAAVTRFLLEWTLALAAFWTTRITGINQIYFVILMFFSGRVAPLALLPDWIQSIAIYLPFYYIVAFPVELLMGRTPADDVVGTICILIAWLLFALFLVSQVWRIAVKRYSAVGS